jgi:hypothetical protein
VYVGSYATDASSVHHPYGSTSPTITKAASLKEKSTRVMLLASPTAVLTFSPATCPPLPPTKSDGGGPPEMSEGAKREKARANSEYLKESAFDGQDSARESERE